MRGAPWILFLLMACSGGGDVPFANLSQVALASGPTRFAVWIADTPESRALGLMNASDADLAVRSDGAIPAMLFVFDRPEFVSFWMRDTEVALDLAYLDGAGEILEVHSLIPLDETPVRSSAPVAYALEVAAGTLAAQGIGVGDFMGLP